MDQISYYCLSTFRVPQVLHKVILKLVMHRRITYLAVAGQEPLPGPRILLCSALRFRWRFVQPIADTSVVALILDNHIVQNDTRCHDQ